MASGKVWPADGRVNARTSQRRSPIRSFSASALIAPYAHLCVTVNHLTTLPTAQSIVRALDRPVTLLSPQLLASKYHAIYRPDLICTALHYTYCAAPHRTHLRRVTHQPASCCSLTCAIPLLLANAAQRAACLPNPLSRSPVQSRPASSSANHALRPPPRSNAAALHAACLSPKAGHRIHAPACSDVHSLHVASSTRQHSTARLHCCYTGCLVLVRSAAPSPHSAVALARTR